MVYLIEKEIHSLNCFSDRVVFICYIKNSFVSGKADIYLDTQHPQGKAGLEKVQEAEDAFLSKYQRQVSGPEAAYPKPVFTTPLKPQFSLGEAEPLHLECTVEPKEDPNLKVEWYFNGKALEHGMLFVQCTSLL